MKKNILIKHIHLLLSQNGYKKEDELCYCRLSEDGLTKYIIRTPDMTQGFLIGVQFDDYGKFNGTFKDSVMQNYEFDNLLHFAKVYDYSETDILNATNRVCEKVEMYANSNREAIKSNLGEWVFGNSSEEEKNNILVCLEMSPIDPYSLDYLEQKVEFIKKGGAFSFPLEEYYTHKDYYDQYATHGCKVIIDEKLERVMIT